MNELAPGTASEFKKSLLLCSVSSGCLLTIFVAGAVFAQEDTKNPTIWIELGAQLEQADRTTDLLAPPLTSTFPASGFENPVGVEKFPRYSIGGTGKLSFAPQGSDWIFTAAISYGRSNGSKHLHEQQAIPPTPNPFLGGTITPTLVKFADTQTKYQTSHTVLDFKVGRDVGVGLLGGAISSQLSLGVRDAGFTSRSQVHISGHPNFHFIKNPPLNFPLVGGNEYYASLDESQSFHGIGPSISWDASVTIAHSSADTRVSMDWGLNFAMLFGRQRAASHHQTTALFYHAPPVKYPTVTLYQSANTPPPRSRSVVVPNIGGFAAISFRYANARISFGYRAEKYFGAMDGGIDTRKAYDQNFFGPFASVSVGLGG